MYLAGKKIFAVVVVLGMIAFGIAMIKAIAAGQSVDAASQAANSSAPVPAPVPKNVAAGQSEAMRLLVLMDADKSGKVSRAEFMTFMAAEFDRLDTNHDGELDIKELEKSQLIERHGGTRR